MRNDIARMMKTAAANVAARVDAHPNEIYGIMRAEWEAGGAKERAQIVRYLQKETAITVH